MFLDVDGTLVDFVVNPDELIANPTLIDLLGELYRLTEGAVALVSGRTIASVDAIFEPLRLPIAGLHGHERRDALGRTHGAPTQSLEERFFSVARQKFNELVVQHHGSFVEDKGAAIALHYRLAPSAAADVEKLAGEFEMQLPESLCVQRGKMVVEIRVWAILLPNYEPDQSIFSWSRRWSSCSWSRMYLRTISLSKPTVDTK